MSRPAQLAPRIWQPFGRMFGLAIVAMIAACAWVGPSARAAAPSPSTAELVNEFKRYSGATLVFDRAQLPGGPKVQWYDRMPALSDARKRRAAGIALREVQRLPPGYLGQVGLTHVGVFHACISRTGDGFRPYNKEHKGYLYYGRYQQSALVAAYYTDSQLPLTLHHEIYHHVDATYRGTVAARAHFGDDDARFSKAIALRKPYKALPLPQHVLSALGAVAGKSPDVLTGAVSDYAKKSPGEDQAETARYLHSHTPAALLQAATKPGLAGSQRLIHIVEQYDRAAPKGAPPILEHLVRDALGESVYVSELDRKISIGRPVDVRAAMGRLSRFGDTSDALRAAEAQAAAWLVRQRIVRHKSAESRRAAGFWVYGKEDADGVNWTLRRDLANHGKDLARVAAVGQMAKSDTIREALLAELLSGVRLMADFHRWLGMNWEVTPGTETAFNSAISEALTPLSTLGRDDIALKLDGAPLPVLQNLIHRDGRLKNLANRYLANVDKAITSPQLRASIRRVQPATVKVATGGSGVNVHPSGRILTNAHVLDYVGRRTQVLFPDGSRFNATCTHIDLKLDLAIATLDVDATQQEALPVAPLASAAPSVGTTVVAIGQPGTRTPSGEATGYGPFHVSVGRIRGFLPNRLGPQKLGRAKHDAWTYWGHSGSPLFNSRGEIVALHNSWDSKTAMRHAVPWEALRAALKRWKLL